MTKEELKQEAEEYALNQWEGNLPWSVIQKAYYDSAEPREKQITGLSKHILELQKDKGHLTDRVRELENKVRFMGEQIDNLKAIARYDQFTKAKNIIKNLMIFAEIDNREYEEAYKEAEQFINEVYK